MSTGLIGRFQQHVESGRLLDLVEDLEKSQIKVTMAGDGFRIDGPAALLSPDLGQLLDSCAEEFRIVLKMSTLAADQFGSTRLYHAVLTQQVSEASLLEGALTLHRPEGDRPRFAAGPRVGITRAADLPYRYFEADGPGKPSRWVSAFRPGTKKRGR